MYIVQCIELYRIQYTYVVCLCVKSAVYSLIHYTYIVEGVKENHKTYKDYRSLVLKEILG